MAELKINYTKLRRYVAQEYRVRKIAKLLGVSTSAIYEACRRKGIKLN